MKAAPFALVGATVLAGWVGLPHVAFAHEVDDATHASVSGEPAGTISQERTQVLRSRGHEPHAAQHAASCTCAACCAMAEATR